MNNLGKLLGAFILCVALGLVMLSAASYFDGAGCPCGFGDVQVCTCQDGGDCICDPALCACDGCTHCHIDAIAPGDESKLGACCHGS